MPLCLGASGSVRISSSHQSATWAKLVQIFSPVIDVLVAVAHRPGAQRRQVAAGAGLAEALAPHLVAAQDAREVLGLLLGAAPRP